MNKENNHIELAKELKRDCLVVDIETSSEFDIRKDFDNYVRTAKCKWIGFYSYKSEKYYDINVMTTPKEKIIQFINAHKTIVSFNGIGFDVPVLENNGLMPNKYMKHVDCQVILGTDKFKHKNRGMLMGYKFKSNSLKNMAKTMKLETMKGDIDYNIFKRDSWNEEETNDIKKYLRGDIEVTKQMFDKLFDFWLPFTEMVDTHNIKKWSWLNVKIASLVYKSACYTMGYKEEYGEHGSKEEIGGIVLLPKQKEAKDVWYVDVTSLYPHMYIMFNLINEIDVSNMSEDILRREIECGNIWHGDDVFQVNGYYDISAYHDLTTDLAYKLKERIRLKKEDSSNPLVYAYKIYLNTFYGANRSSVFKNIHTKNSGTDCCLLGQQVNKIMQEKSKDMGYDVKAGDTDSIFITHSEQKTKEEVKSDMDKISKHILQNVPFPVDTFGIDLETGDKLDYMMWVPDAKSGKFKKKNYAYIYNKNGKKNVKIMGLPIKKSNATSLGMKIFKEHIEQKMIDEKNGKFEDRWISNLIKEELKINMQLMAVEYRCSPFDTYSVGGRGCINAQTSLAYLDGNGGNIKLLKNTKVGKVGKGFKYCTLEEAKEYGLTYKDLDLTKVFNELTPFTNGKIEFTKTKSFF